MVFVRDGNMLNVTPDILKETYEEQYEIDKIPINFDMPVQHLSHRAEFKARGARGTRNSVTAKGTGGKAGRRERKREREPERFLTSSIPDLELDWLVINRNPARTKLHTYPTCVRRCRCVYDVMMLLS